VILDDGTHAVQFTVTDDFNGRYTENCVN
jgi:hypothetical protein